MLTMFVLYILCNCVSAWCLLIPYELGFIYVVYHLFNLLYYYRVVVRLVQYEEVLLPCDILEFLQLLFG